MPKSRKRKKAVDKKRALAQAKNLMSNKQYLDTLTNLLTLPYKEPENKEVEQETITENNN